MSDSSNPRRLGLTRNGRRVSPGGSRCSCGHLAFDHEAPAGLEIRGHVEEALDLLVLGREVLDRVVHEVGELRTCRPPLWSRSRRLSRRWLAASGFAWSFATIAGDSSMPCTRTPRSLSGTATRPVPMPSSRAAPSPARWARKSTVWSEEGGIEHLRRARVVARRDSFVEVDLLRHAQEGTSGTRASAAQSAGVPPARDCPRRSPTWGRRARVLAQRDAALEPGERRADAVVARRTRARGAWRTSGGRRADRDRRRRARRGWRHRSA